MIATGLITAMNRIVAVMLLAAVTATTGLAQPPPNPYPNVTVKGNTIDLTNQKGGKCSRQTLPHITPDQDGDLLVLRVLDSRGYDFEIWCHDASAPLNPLSSWEWNFRLSYPNKNKTTLIDKCELPGGFNHIIMRFNKKLKKKDISERGRLPGGGKSIRVKAQIIDYYHHNYNGSDDFHLAYNYRNKQMTRINTKRKAGGRKAKERITGRESDTIALINNESSLLYADPESGFALALDEIPATPEQVNTAVSANDVSHEIMLVESFPHNEADPPLNLTKANASFLERSVPGNIVKDVSSCEVLQPEGRLTSAQYRVDPFVVKKPKTGFFARLFGYMEKFELFHPSIVEIEAIEHTGRCLLVQSAVDHVGYISLGIPKKLLDITHGDGISVEADSTPLAAMTHESRTHIPPHINCLRA